MIRLYEYPSIFTVIYFLIYFQAIAQTKINVGDFLSKDERHSVHGTLFSQAGDEETLEIQGFEYKRLHLCTPMKSRNSAFYKKLYRACASVKRITAKRTSSGNGH